MSFLQNPSDELLASLCQTVGAHKFQPTSGTSSSLHRAWQSEVSSLRTTALLTDEDLRLIKKYVNLQQLRLGTNPSSPYGRPAWFSVAKLAPSLTNLVELAISSGDSSSYDVLKTLVGLESLRTRLKRLALTSGQIFNGTLPYIINDDTIHALSDLKGLRSLILQYQAVRASHEALQLCTSQLSRLTALALHSFETEEDISSYDGSKLSIFPGSLTNLVSLSLCQALDYEELDDGPDALKKWQQQHLIIAVSALRDLESLHTDYHILTVYAQQQALGFSHSGAPSYAAGADCWVLGTSRCILTAWMPGLAVYRWPVWRRGGSAISRRLLGGFSGAGLLCRSSGAAGRQHPGAPAAAATAGGGSL
jgi:hypothetical protein